MAQIQHLEEFNDNPIGLMRKAAEYFEQNPVMYTHPINKKTKAIARIGLRAVFFLPARERSSESRRKSQAQRATQDS